MAEVDSADAQYVLPNGLSVWHRNRAETDFVYSEIFVERIYQRYGISVPDNACVFDVGANIGLFSLFIKMLCPEARVFAFEPIPEVHRLLRLNTEAFEDSVKTYQCGVSDRKGQTQFTYYPGYSIMSGFHSDSEQDRKILAQGVLNQLPASVQANHEMASRIADNIVEKKLGDAVRIDCPLVRLSDVIEESGVAGIDLLKVDAEKAELEVLDGIDSGDWPKIRQVIMETHSESATQTATDMLRENGFIVHAEIQDQLAGAAVANIFARRPEGENS